MNEREVPQDAALLGVHREVCYALDDNGTYVLVRSAGWEPANVANVLAWEHIRAELGEVLTRVRAGALSPLAYHMARHQMSAAMLASHVGLFAWQVRRHMKVGPFGRMRSRVMERYAAVFKMSCQQLASVPDETVRL